jgi:hypothetical protein
MNAMQAYEPKTAPAQAVTAAGLVVSALRADARIGAAWLIGNSPMDRLFPASGHRPTTGLEAASVR